MSDAPDLRRAAGPGTRTAARIRDYPSGTPVLRVKEGQIRKPRRADTALLALTLVLGLALAGCETLSNVATSPDTAKTRRGAAIGAAAGAVAGLLTKGDKLDNAMIGAAIGNYQDRQERKLREQLAGSVIAYLANRGVPERRMIKVGAGEQHPVASNATAEGRERGGNVPAARVGSGCHAAPCITSPRRPAPRLRRLVARCERRVPACGSAYPTRSTRPAGARPPAEHAAGAAHHGPADSVSAICDLAHRPGWQCPVN